MFVLQYALLYIRYGCVGWFCPTYTHLNVYLSLLERLSQLVMNEWRIQLFLPCCLIVCYFLENHSVPDNLGISCLGSLNYRLNGRNWAMPRRRSQRTQDRASEAADNCARWCPADDVQCCYRSGSRITYARCASERESETPREIGHYERQEKHMILALRENMIKSCQ